MRKLITICAVVLVVSVQVGIARADYYTNLDMWPTGISVSGGGTDGSVGSTGSNYGPTSWVFNPSPLSTSDSEGTATASQSSVVMYPGSYIHAWGTGTVSKSSNFVNAEFSFGMQFTSTVDSTYSIAIDMQVTPNNIVTNSGYWFHSYSTGDAIIPDSHGSSTLTQSGTLPAGGYMFSIGTGTGYAPPFHVPGTSTSWLPLYPLQSQRRLRCLVLVR
jgi:hypothetical protein